MQKPPIDGRRFHTKNNLGKPTHHIDYLCFYYSTNFKRCNISISFYFNCSKLPNSSLLKLHRNQWEIYLEFYRHFLLLLFPISLRISRYSQISVTVRAKA